MEKFFREYRFRPILYGTILAIGFAFLIFIKRTFSTDIFVLSSFALYLVLLAELYFTSNHFVVLKRKNTKILYNFERHKFIQYIHHIALPSIFFVSLVSLIFFISGLLYPSVILVFCALIFIILFENIYSFYHHDFSLQKSTNFVYDALSLILIFISTDAIISFSNYFDLGNIFTFAMILILFSFVTFLVLIRHGVDRNQIYIYVLLQGICAWLLFFLLNAGFGASQISIFLVLVLSTYIYYVYHHHKNLKFSEIVDYVIILCLVMAILSLNQI